VASGAKDAADKVADAAPDKGFLGGLFSKAPDASDVKSAAGDAASAAKDALPDSGTRCMEYYLNLSSPALAASGVRKHCPPPPLLARQGIIGHNEG